MVFVARFSTTSDLISMAIRKRTDFFISHVEFQLVAPWNGHAVGETLGSRFPDGVKWRPESENKAQRNVCIAMRPGIDDAARWVNDNRLGWKYDLLGTVGIGLGDRDWYDSKQRFCSEVFVEGFERGTIEQLFNQWAKPWEITPRDTFIIPGWSLISGPDFLMKPGVTHAVGRSNAQVEGRGT